MICQTLTEELERAQMQKLITYKTLTSSETKIYFFGTNIPLEKKLRLKSYIENAYAYQTWLSNDENTMTVFHVAYTPLHNPT